MEETERVSGPEIPEWWKPIMVAEQEVISLLAAGHAAAFLGEPDAHDILQGFVRQANLLLHHQLTFDELARAYFRYLWDQAIVQGNMLAQSALSINDEETG